MRLHLLPGIFGRAHGVPDCAFAFENLVVVPAGVRLVPEEVDVVEVVRHELQAVRLVPPFGEHVERNLSAHGVRQVVLLELRLQHFHELRPYSGGEVELFELVPLGLAAVPADRADVQHTVPELDEGPAFDRDIKVGDVDQNEVQQFLEFVLAQVIHERSGF